LKPAIWWWTQQTARRNVTCRTIIKWLGGDLVVFFKNCARMFNWTCQYRWRWHPGCLHALAIRPKTKSTEFVQQQFVGLFHPRGTKPKMKSPNYRCSVYA
jgi:hypothetical protein